MISAEEWDTRYWQIYEDAMRDGVDSTGALIAAETECTEQFGDRPQDTKEQ